MYEWFYPNVMGEQEEPSAGFAVQTCPHCMIERIEQMVASSQASHTHRCLYWTFVSLEAICVDAHLSEIALFEYYQKQSEVSEERHGKC